jgi:cell division septation protein DedD
MQRGSGGTVFEPVQSPERGDRELTLGPFLLTLLGFGLFGLCGLCFVFGYAVGHRHAESSTTISVPPAVPPSIVQTVSAQSKPAAGQSGQPPAAGSDFIPPTEPDTTTAPVTDQSATTAAGNQPVVASQSAAQSSAGIAQPAIGQGSVMVQIAAVSHPEDADVLVGALRKRGYAVTAHRDPTDGLLHVQIGPFANRTDAYAMRQKLLNDGYNAIVQP